jgi:hypothetical protein
MDQTQIELSLPPVFSSSSSSSSAPVIPQGPLVLTILCKQAQFDYEQDITSVSAESQRTQYRTRTLLLHRPAQSVYIPVQATPAAAAASASSTRK